MILHNTIGVDFGSNTIKIYDVKNDIITKEKNMIAIRDNREVIAIGNDAYEMFEKTPANIKVHTPISNGRINDVFEMEAVLHTVLKSKDFFVGYRPTMFFAVPTALTPIEQRAFRAVARRGKLRKCKIYLVDKPIIDALSLGIPLNRTKGSMIINIGSDFTEVSVISEARVVINKQILTGGRHLDESIRSNIRRKNNLLIGLKTAQRLKFALADMQPVKKEGRKIMGLDQASGIPRDGIVTTTTIGEAIRRDVAGIAREVQTALNRTPPQIRESIQKEGIYLTGGSTRIKNIDKYLSRKLECSVRLSLSYDLCTIVGLKEFITHPALHHFSYPVN